jgi:excinuclease ABC subunit C
MPLKNTREVPLGPAPAGHDPGGERATVPNAVPTGPHVIAQYLKTLPGSPGVYRMLDAAGTVIYVG